MKVPDSNRIEWASHRRVLDTQEDDTCSLSSSLHTKHSQQRSSNARKTTQPCRRNSGGAHRPGSERMLRRRCRNRRWWWWQRRNPHSCHRQQSPDERHGAAQGNLREGEPGHQNQVRTNGRRATFALQSPRTSHPRLANTTSSPWERTKFRSGASLGGFAT
jgi:hypothetical protein